MANQKHKSKIHIKTNEYEFVEVEFEGTPEEISDKREELILAIKGGDGLPKKEWYEALDKMLSGESGDIEIHEKMSKNQRLLIKEISRSFNRIEYKDRK